MDVHNVDRVDERSKEMDGRMKATVEGFKKTWSIGLG